MDFFCKTGEAVLTKCQNASFFFQIELVIKSPLVIFYLLDRDLIVQVNKEYISTIYAWTLI